MFSSLQSRLKKASRLLPVMLLPVAAWAQAPANDNPSGAVALTLGATCTPVSTTNAGATTTSVTGLGYINPGCGIATAPKDVWYTFTTNASGLQGSTAATITVAGTVAGQVRVFGSTTGAAGPFTEVGCSAGTTNNTQAPALNLRGLTPSTTYYVDVSGYGSGDTQGAFTICASVLTIPTSDVAVASILTVSKLPIPQGAPHIVRATVTNPGLNAQTNIVVTLTVTGANAFTDTQTITSLASGATATVSFAPFTPTAGGNNTLTVSTPADADNTNNSKSTIQLVNATTFSYADASAPTSARGFGPSTTATNAFLTSFTVGASTSVTQVRAYLVDFVGAGAGSTIGKTVYGVVMDPATGAVLGRSADFVVTAASLNTYTALTLNTPVTIASGSFLVGLAQTYQTGQATQYFPLGTQPEVPGRANTFYTSSITTPATPTDVGVSIAARYMLEAVTAPTTAPTCAPVTALTAGSVTQTGATLTFTAPTGGSSYVITYSANGGAVTTVTPAPTASPVVLTGLTPATTYTVSVATSCGAGQVSPPTITTFTTALPNATYATVPFTEGFEGPWITVASLRDVPSNSWRNTPALGDNSWRREDDGVSAGWVSNSGAYTPVSSQGAHSARFHTYDVASGGIGTLDMYVDLSGTGSKSLTFDYINTTGTDVLAVLVSTDGGATFAATPVASYTTSATFSAKTIALASTSATTVIRFRATSDFGLTDLGIDNVRVSVVTATRNEALAATVNLYPNPAHGTFALTIPAGSLHAASATLANALGQVVLTRQLSLPAAGGTADFDVSRLAPGVYTLSLKSGNDLVVKRVVVE